MQSPFSFAASLNSYHGLSTGPVAPSPVKKKLSLGDYMSRRSNLATTPTIEKAQGHAMEPATAAAQSAMAALKVAPAAEDKQAPPSVLVQDEALALGAAGDSAIANPPMTDEAGADALTRTAPAPQLLPITSNSLFPHTRPLATPPGVIAPDVASVVSTLNAIMPMSGSRRSHSASSS
jgi:hypothetical protein